MSANIHLLIRGDDAGLYPGVTDAVLAAAEAGLLRNTSIMVPAPAFADAAARLRQVPGLCLGLHATINSEWVTPRWGPVLPTAQVPSLVDAAGWFYPLPHQTSAAGVKLDEVMAEVQAQLARARAAGLPIAYLDTHCCFEWFEHFAMGARLREFARAEGLVIDRDLPGLPPVAGEFANDCARLIAQLEAAPPGCYKLVCHLGRDDDAMRALLPSWIADPQPGAVARDRAAEAALLTDPALIDYCRTHGVACIRYTDLPAVEA